MSRCPRTVALFSCERVQALAGLICARWLTCELFRPRDGVHALGLLAGAIVAACLLQRGLGRRELVRRRPVGTFGLLRCRGPPPLLTLYVLRRSRASLRRLIHRRGRRMLRLSGA